MSSRVGTSQVMSVPSRTEAASMYHRLTRGGGVCAATPERGALFGGGQATHGCALLPRLDYASNNDCCVHRQTLRRPKPSLLVSYAASYALAAFYSVLGPQQYLLD